MKAGSRGLLLIAVLTSLAPPVQAEDDPPAVLEFKFTPTVRPQIAIWVEDGDGNFKSTVALTEATAFRGIGNRPGASEMNSGYRWPYGRREGVLPVWGTRRASAQGAAQFNRVIFQNRTYEGLASRTSSDQSVDAYYCLSFTQANSSKDALDAVSCASVFTSDKGRYITPTDVAGAYAEPYEALVTFTGTATPLPLTSLYPPRMDVERCELAGCYDHVDLADFSDHARSVMPEIDAVTMATPQGDVAQSLLFTVPEHWGAGDYVAWLEINVEGDHNATFSEANYPTPSTPAGQWDSWAQNYGYAYRGQPSVLFKVPFVLDEVGETSYATTDALGASSWDVWSAGYGQMQGMGGVSNDPSGASGSGADRLKQDGSGDRFTVVVSVLGELPEEPPPPPVDGDGQPTEEDPEGVTELAEDPTRPDMKPSNAPANEEESTVMVDKDKTGSVDDDQGSIIISSPGSEIDGPVGPIRKFRVSHHDDRSHAHDWVKVSFKAPDTDLDLHSYEVRVSTEPITSEETFIEDGRPAKTATEDAEGATSLMLPVDRAPGKTVRGEIGDLVALTHYYIGIRARDRLNRHGPISVAEVTTKERVFTTVTPCFVATAAYGSTMHAEVGALRRLRDRHLMTHGAGRWLVATYYTHGPKLARAIEGDEMLRAGARTLLRPFVDLARWLDD